MLPILVLGFVRLESLKATIESILAQEHGPIYVSCDAPPSQYQEKGIEVHNYINSLLYSGKVQEVRISTSHEGILTGVSNGISWFFDRVGIGIILEDDLVLQFDLLKSVELASNFLGDPRLVAIGLHNHVPNKFIGSKRNVLRSSRFVISWGWVTSKEHWNTRIRTYGEVDYVKLFFKMTPLIGISSSLYHLYYYRRRVRVERTNLINCTWADLWQINAFMKGLKVLTYNKNFIEYIGHGEFASNTIARSAESKYPVEKITESELDSNNFSFEIGNIDRRADRYYTKNRRVSTIIRSKLSLGTILNFNSKFNLKFNR